MRHPILLSLTLALTLTLAVTAAPSAAGVDARLLRMPDVSATDIAFVYAGDIWVVPKTGGTAQRLSTPKGEEAFPRFSPDGTRIAFSGNYDGNLDLYVIPAAGGLPARVTHHPAPDRMLEWTPDGAELLYATPMTSEKDRFNKLYRVSAVGGLPAKPQLKLNSITQVVNVSEHDPHTAHLLWRGVEDLSAEVRIARAGKILSLEVVVEDDIFDWTSTELAQRDRIEAFHLGPFTHRRGNAHEA